MKPTQILSPEKRGSKAKSLPGSTFGWFPLCSEVSRANRTFTESITQDGGHGRAVVWRPFAPRVQGMMWVVSV